MKILISFFLVFNILYAKKIEFLTAGKDGSYYATVKNCIDKELFEVIPTKGSLDNLKILKKDSDNKNAIVQEDVIELLTSLNEIQKVDNSHFLYGGKNYFFVPLTNYKETILFLSKDKTTISANDLNGKTIAIGRVGTGSNITANIMKSHLWKHGIKIKTVYYNSLKDLANSLKNGYVDYAILVQKLTNNLYKRIKSMNINFVKFKSIKIFSNYLEYDNNMKIISYKGYDFFYVTPIIVTPNGYEKAKEYIECLNR